MQGQYPILSVDEQSSILDRACLGLVPIENGTRSTLLAIADGQLPPIPEWKAELQQTAIAISYVHAKPSHWYGRVRAGKFTDDARHRLIKTLSTKLTSAVWIDQALIHRTSDQTIRALKGLLPYATFPVLAVGNFSSLSNVLADYRALRRFKSAILTDDTMTTLEDILTSEFTSEKQCINFVEMCRFWPTVERSMGRKGCGVSFEPETLTGLQQWRCILSTAKTALDHSNNISLVLSDMCELVINVLFIEDDQAFHQGLHQHPLNSLATTTSSLGSGALHNAPLFEPADRNALQIAGMCFALLTNSPETRKLNVEQFVQVIENPYAAFALLAEHIPADFRVISNIHASADTLYNRSLNALVEVERLSFADEITVFSQDTAKKPLQRNWLGIWEQIPHLSILLSGELLDITERAINSPPYNNHHMQRCKLPQDITGKAVRAVLSAMPSTAAHEAIPVVAISLFEVISTLHDDEGGEIEDDLCGWTKSIVFIGLCDRQRKRFMVEATVLVHLQKEESKLLEEKRIKEVNAVTWLKSIILRSSSTPEKVHWVQEWIKLRFPEQASPDAHNWSWNFNEEIHTAMEELDWVKWIDQVPPEPNDSVLRLRPSVNCSFPKLSAIGVYTKTTRPQLPLYDVIQFVKVALLLASRFVSANHSRPTSSDSIDVESLVAEMLRSHHQRVFETWLGLLTGLYRAYELENGVTQAEKLNLFLPTYKLVGQKLELYSITEVLGRNTAFVLGLKQTGVTIGTSSSTIEMSALSWDKNNADDFWAARKCILSTAQLQCMMLNLQVLCLTITASIEVDNSSARQDSPDVLGQTSTPFKAMLRPGVYGMVTVHQFFRELEHLSSGLCSGKTKEVCFRILEHVICSTRMPLSSADWRLPADIIEAVHICLSDSDEDEPLSAEQMQVDTLLSSLETCHWVIRHVLSAKIAVEGNESYGEATRRSFESLLTFPARKDDELNPKKADTEKEMEAKQHEKAPHSYEMNIANEKMEAYVLKGLTLTLDFETQRNRRIGLTRN